MANKRYDQFGATTPTTTRILLTADPATGTLGKCTTQAILDLATAQNNAVSLLQAAGSQIKSVSLNLNPFSCLGNSLGSSGALILQLIYLPAGTYNGAWYLQASQGNYTANNYNGMCLYSQAAGSATLIASSTNNGNLFKAAANTFVQSAFSATVTVSAGTYYVGLLYSSSAQVGRPDFWTSTTNIASVTGKIFDMTNSNRIQCFIASQTSLPSPITLSTTGGGATQPIIMGVY